MKNTIFTAFIIFTFTYKPVYAAFDFFTDCGVPEQNTLNCADADDDEITCQKIAGCYYNEDVGDCLLAPIGTYTTGKPEDLHGQQYLTCNIKPNAASFTGYLDGISFQGGMPTNTCPWQITCAKEEYWNKTKLKCEPCTSVTGYMAKSNNSTKIIYGCTLQYTDDNDFWDRCTPEPFSVTLNPSSPYRDDLAEFDIYVKFNSSDTTQDGGFSNSATASSWSKQPGQSLILPRPNLEWWNKPNGDTEYGFLGYKEGTVQYITGTGNLAPEVSITDFSSNMELTGVWQNVYYDVIYYTADGTEYGDRQRKINIDTKKLPDGNDALAYSTGPSMDGKVFSGWTCNLPSTCKPQSGQRNCEKTCTVLIINKNTSVPPPSSGKYEALYTDASLIHTNSVHLYPRYTDCPAGYYCKNGEQKACPAGTTSDEGAKTAEDCYVPTGATFTDSNGSFSLGELGATGDIFYAQ